MSKKKKALIISLSSVFGTILVLVIAFLFYSSIYYHATTEANNACEDSYSELVSVRKESKYIAFLPNSEYDTGIVFYPGAKVEEESYAPLMQEIAKEGIACFIVRMPLRFAFFNFNGADVVKNDYKDLKLYMSGHSLGGAMASYYLSNHKDSYEGIILLASYSTKDLKGERVLSIYGEHDTVLKMGSYNNNKTNLPDDYTEYVIAGGNHAQFGKYGGQKGDGIPDITPNEQISIAASHIVTFIKNGS